MTYDSWKARDIAAEQWDEFPPEHDNQWDETNEEPEEVMSGYFEGCPVSGEWINEHDDNEIDMLIKREVDMFTEREKLRIRLIVSAAMEDMLQKIFAGLDSRVDLRGIK